MPIYVLFSLSTRRNRPQPSAKLDIRVLCCLLLRRSELCLPFNTHRGERRARGLVQSIFSSPSRRSKIRTYPKSLAPRRWAKNALHYVPGNIIHAKTTGGSTPPIRTQTGQQIGRSCSIGVSTVHKYLKRAEAAGVTWPLPEDWDEARVNAVVFPRREPTIAENSPARTPPDFAAIYEQLRSSKYVTLQLL